VAAEIAAAGATAVAIGMDVTSDQDRTRAIDLADELGGLDILVNNAGIFTAQPPLEVDAPSWGRVFDVNVEALFFCCQAAIPSMVARGWGRIINLSSTAARVGNPTMIAYNASKAAVLAITRGLALEYGPHGVTVNAVLPGIVDTPMWQALDTEVAPLLGFAPGTLMADRIGRIPVGRAGTPDDVAAMIAFLASNDAGYVTGQSLHVCGGLSMP
jgi:NAD(P)-dependent dehydrogenase (short-subunit alcohol dehydrogenase family)